MNSVKVRVLPNVSHYFVTPAEHYSERLRRREIRLAQVDRLHARIGTVRLVLGAAGLLTAWMSFGAMGIAPAWMMVPIVLFVTLVLYHVRVRAWKTKAQTAVAFYQSGLERIADQWRGKGRTGDQFDVQQHIYGGDLDLFGKGSLYELLCAARTSMGEHSLARWLLAPADVATLHERHHCILDLRGRLDLREDLACLGDTPRIEMRAEVLIDWATAPNQLNHRWLRWAAILLAALAVAGCVVWAVWGLRYPLLAVILIEIFFAYQFRGSVRAAIVGIESAHQDLKELAAFLNRIEGETFAAAPLRELVGKLSSHARSASVTIAQLATVVNFVESRRNPLLTPLLLLLMYPLQTALAAERWRAQHGDAVRAWLEVLGDFEALLSLARYSYERPADPFPEFSEGAARFQAEELGHPLIPAAAQVCNDVDISGRTRVWLISGSNMSGKSTLLRSVGINTVLAMAGAPVRAKHLRLTPLQIGASIRINDSLHEGSSRFYAEITRLRQLFEPSPIPLLFLLDELLQGTNSADRRVGAQGVIKALLDRGAIGLISTHDLALTDIEGLKEGTLVNVHFQDEFVDGRLTFDFKLRHGIVTKSNGVELMRSIGLDV